MSKPDNWNELSDKEKNEIGLALFRTDRGQLMIGKALYHSAKSMMNQKYPEASDAEDMELIGESVFPTGYFIEVYMENFRKTGTAQ